MWTLAGTSPGGPTKHVGSREGRATLGSGLVIDVFGISFAHASVRGHSTKQAFSAAEVAREEYFFCGPSPGMFIVYSVFIPNDL